MSDYNHSISLSLISRLNYKNKNEILLVNYLTMILHPKNKARNLN